MSTFRTGLRGVTRVNFDYLDTTLLCFVCDKVIELSKGPSMQLALSRDILILFASSNLTILSDVLEVFQNDSATRSSVLSDTFAKDMIAISVETRLMLTHFLEVTLSGLRSFRLQFAPYTKILPVSFFPMLVAKELTLGGNGWSVQAEVYPDDLIISRDIRIRNLYHYMQPVLSFAVNKIGSSYPMSLVLGTVRRDSKGNVHSAVRGRQASGLFFPIKRVGMNVVPRGTKFTGRTLHWLELRDWIALLLGLFNAPFIRSFMFLLPSKSGGQGFSSFDAGLNEQVTHQSRTGHLCITVRLMMQTYTVLFLILPTISAYLVECLRELRNRFIQGFCLLRSGVKVYLYCSVHTKSIPYMETFCQEERFSSLWAAFFHPHI